MRNNESNINKNILEFLVSMCLFGTSLQYGISYVIGINVNLFYIEALILGLYLILNLKEKMEINVKILIFDMLVLFLFTFNLLFNSNSYGEIFFYDFVRSSLILIIAFLFNIDFKRVVNYSVKICSITLIILLLICIENKMPVNDYMVFGFHFFACFSFMLLYFALMGKWKIFFCFLLMSPIVLVYSSKTCWYMLAILYIVILYWSNCKKIYKILGTAISVLIFFNLKDITAYLVLTLTKYTSYDSYALRTISMILNGDHTSGNILGSRYYIYKSALETIKENPALGVGIGKFGSADGIYPHNFFLDVMVTFGIVIGGLIIIYLVYLVIRSIKLNKQYKMFYIILVWAIVNFMRLMTTHTFLSDPIFYILFGLGIIGSVTISSTNSESI